jgi:hypothetical protein
MGLKESYYNYYYLLLIKEKTHIYIKFLFKVRNLWSQNFKNYFLQYFVVFCKKNTKVVIRLICG